MDVSGTTPAGVSERFVHRSEYWLEAVVRMIPVAELVVYQRMLDALIGGDTLTISEYPTIGTWELKDEQLPQFEDDEVPGYYRVRLLLRNPEGGHVFTLLSPPPVL